MNKIFDFLPEEVHASVEIGELIVHTNPLARNAAVELEPISADDEDALKAIKSAVVEQQGTRLVVKVRDGGGGTGGATVIQSRGGSISVSSVGNNSVVIGNGVTMIGGRIVSGGTVHIGGCGVRAILHVPATVAATLHARSGMAQVYGDLARLDAETGSGSLAVSGEVDDAEVGVGSGSAELSLVHRLEAQAGSGSLNIGTVLKRGRVRVGSGSAHVHTETADFRARGGSGSLHITTAPGVVLDEDDVTVGSGSRHVSVRR